MGKLLLGMAIVMILLSGCQKAEVREVVPIPSHIPGTPVQSPGDCELITGWPPVIWTC
jgi:hypothetical protein